jgi:hypothetical protein
MNKKVFLSYGWGNSEHQEWVVNLATRLMNDTVDVTLDRWSLKDGHDIHSFMEEMVKSEDVFRVLILSNKKYSEKANEREGGVGTETQIITPNLYTKERQEKFIPIVLERDEDGEPYLPIYLKSRKYIDFSRVETYEESYEELLRNILEAPSIPKPKLGTKPPAYITDNTLNLSETNNKLRTIENQIKKAGTASSKEIKNFIELFLNNLWEFEIKDAPNDLLAYGEVLYNTLKSYKPLREDFLKLVNIMSSNKIENSSDLLIEFFELEPVYRRPKDQNEGSWVGTRFEIFNVIFHELFIYTIAISLHNKNYELVADLLHSKYYKRDRSERKSKPEDFTFLCSYHRNLEEYSSRSFNKITGFGDYMITNLSELLGKDDLILADTICYFVSYLEKQDVYSNWFPYTHLYSERSSITFFDKLTSNRHFENVKVIFNVKSKQELSSKLTDFAKKSNERISYGRGRHVNIPFINELVDPETLAIYR